MQFITLSSALSSICERVQFSYFPLLASVVLEMIILFSSPKNFLSIISSLSS
jgi:hypothetical protein